MKHDMFLQEKALNSRPFVLLLHSRLKTLIWALVLSKSLLGYYVSI